MTDTKHCLVPCLLLLPLALSAADIKGHFVSSVAGQPYRVSVESADTLNRWKTEGSFYEPSFTINVPYKGHCTLAVMQEGKMVYTDSLYIADSDIQLGELRPMATVNLGEVQVKARKISIRRDGMDYTISNIQGTHLGDAGNLVDMLKWTPGVTVSRSGQEEQFNVTGRGTAMVYVNGKKVNTSAELRGQRSNLVTKIEVIREPDVQYKASTRAVIRITTRRPVEDFLGASVYNRTSFKRRVSNSSTIDISGKQGIVSGNLSLGFAHDRSLAYTYKENVITHSADDIYTDVSRSTNRLRSNYTNLFAGLNFSLSKKSLLAVQYANSHLRSHPQEDIHHYITDHTGTYGKDDGQRYRYDDSHNYTYTAAYTYTRNDQSALNLTASYTHKKQEQDKNLRERMFATGTTTAADRITSTALHSADKYDYCTFDGTYTFKPKGLDTETVGMNYGYIHNSNPYSTNGKEQLARRNDNWAAAFIKGGKTFSNGLTLQLGLRYEYNYSILNPGSTGRLATHSSFFIPDVRLKYRKGDNSYKLSYTRYAGNPEIYQLNPVVEYIDSLHYSTGNPLLRSYYGNGVSFSSSLSDLSFSVGYTWGRKMPLMVNMQEEGSNVIKYMPISSDRYTMLNADVSYSIDSRDGRFTSEFDAGADYVTSTYTANNRRTTNRHGSFNVSVDLGWAFIKNWRLFGDLFYQTPRMNAGYRYDYQLSSNIGISARLLKKRLRVSLTANELFNRGVAPTATRFTYLNVYERVRNDYNLRGVSLSLSYNFNDFRSKYRRAYTNPTTNSRTVK